MACFIPSLLPALQESPPGGESLAPESDEGDSMILCLCVHTSSVVTSTYMIPCSIVRLCSGVLLLSNSIVSSHLSYVAFSYSAFTDAIGKIGTSGEQMSYKG